MRQKAKAKPATPEMTRHMVLMTVDDKRAWAAAATREGLTLGAWMRRCCIVAAGGIPGATGPIRASSIKGEYK